MGYQLTSQLTSEEIKDLQDSFNKIIKQKDLEFRSDTNPFSVFCLGYEYAKQELCDHPYRSLVGEEKGIPRCMKCRKYLGT